MSFDISSVMKVTQIISVVGQVVRQVEGLLPESPGKEKLDAALKILDALVGGVSAIQPALEALISTLVVVFKFNKAAQPANIVTGA